MTRYLFQMRSRVEEETRMHSLPLDQSLNIYVLHTLLMSSKSDTRITTALKAVRCDSLGDLYLVISPSPTPHALHSLWSWWKSPPLYNPSLVDILKGKSRFIEKKSVEKLFHTISMTFISQFWNWRNKILHASSDPVTNAIRHEDIFLQCKDCLFYGLIIVLLRNSSHRKNWIQNPDELASSSLS
nr:RNA-directed DNA polymerase, eukaryota, reverse transcriptase zinc-binding domain protein [Tanacetum cinerariifolium]